MNHFLLKSSSSIHRMATRATVSGGIRWSSYVGDVRYSGGSQVSHGGSSMTTTTMTRRHSSSGSSGSSGAAHERLLILGSGVAGCSTALVAARNGIPVTILHAGSSRDDCNSYWAQGGVIYRNYRLKQDGSNIANGSNNNNKLKEEGSDGIGNGNGKRNHNHSNNNHHHALVDTPRSLVNDIRIASGYLPPLQRRGDLEEGRYSIDMVLNTTNNNTNTDTDTNTNTSTNKSATNGNTTATGGSKSTTKSGALCPTSGITWNEDAAWKLAMEGPSRIRQLLLGKRDGGEGEIHGCVVPFDRINSNNINNNNNNNNKEEGEDDVVVMGGGLEMMKKKKDEDNNRMMMDDNDVLSLCLEASHAAPRIIHHADCTGKAITTHITQAAANHPLIEFVSDAVVTDLIFDESGNSASTTTTNSNDGLVIGAQVLNKQTNQVSNYYAVHGVVLASGGLAGIYQHSTNPLGFNALGSSVGLAMRLENRLFGPNGGNGATGASNTGGIVSDLEYVQFHPTSLFLPNEARFLLTEALRGEGAILRDMEGKAFARDYHPNGELAPRDIVARAVFCETQKAEEHNAYLDITHRDSDWLKGRFPSIHGHLASRRTPMDFTKEWIPVIPAAHYTCGGVTTDLNGCVRGNNGWYRNLYAAGEAARTGLHGGNRLASTSLLEGLVYGASVGEMVAGVEGNETVVEASHLARQAIQQRLAMEQSSARSSSGPHSSGSDSNASREATAILTHLKSLMWDNVGVVRNPSKLATAVSELAAIRDEADRLWEGGSNGVEVVALRDAAYSGLAVAEAALANRVSGGAHYVTLNEEEEQRKHDMKSVAMEEEAVGEQDSDDDEDGLVAARG